MKLTVERDALLRALDHARRIVEAKSATPVLLNVALMAGVAGLVVRATDTNLQAETTCAVDIERNGGVTVPVKTMVDFLDRLPKAASVTLETGNDGRIALRSGRARAALPTLPLDDFPDLRFSGDTHTFSLPGKDLAAMLRAVDFAISTEETRYYLKGIYLHVLDVEGVSTLRAVATDGHRLARTDLPAPEGSAGMVPIILPRKAQGEIAKLADAAGEDSVSLRVSPAGLSAASGGSVLTTKVMDAMYPDYQRVTPTGNDRHLTIESSVLSDALHRALAVIGERGKSVGLSVEADRVTVTIAGDGGETHEEIEASLDGEPIDVRFNARYAREIIAAIDSDTLRIEFGDPGTASIWRPGSGDGLFCILMPMRA